MEQRFAALIWAHAPVSSGELVRLCAEAFGWKKSTTYTMLKRLCQRGLFVNRGGTVTACISEEEYQVRRGEVFLQDAFGGSLPQFLAAFTRRNKLSGADCEELRRLIDEYQED